MIPRQDIQFAVANDAWQAFRLSLKGLSTDTKLKQLRNYLKINKNNCLAEIQVLNYYYALKRAGLV